MEATVAAEGPQVSLSVTRCGRHGPADKGSHLCGLRPDSLELGLTVRQTLNEAHEKLSEPRASSEELPKVSVLKWTAGGHSLASVNGPTPLPRSGQKHRGNPRLASRETEQGTGALCMPSPTSL